MAKLEEKLGGDTFAFFTRNPRGGKSKAVSDEEIRAMLAFLEEHHFAKLVAHAPYTMNLCSAKEEVRAYAREVLQEDLALMERIPGQYLNFHPGSHLKQGYEQASQQIVDAINEVLQADTKTTLLLETMAGKGTEVGRTFQELQGIIERIEQKDKIGVCLDTCHVWEGGYDIVNNLDGVLKEFDQVIGLERLKAIHLNDSKNTLGAHKDRHEKLGQGGIGADAIRRIIQHPALQDLPFILETPNDDAGYAEEIAWVKENQHA